MFGRMTGLLDDILIVLILAVTVAHVSHFLAHFESPDLKWISIPQAIAMDGANTRSGYLYRIYKGQKQRQWALTGLLFFSACSVVFNYGTTSGRALACWKRWHWPPFSRWPWPSCRTSRARRQYRNRGVPNRPLSRPLRLVL